jgi:outer membrane translocation and assembly module TamA
MRGWVKYFMHVTLQDSIEHTKYLVGETNKNKFTPKPPIISNIQDTRPMEKGKGKLDESIRRELRSKQLCFTYKE